MNEKFDEARKMKLENQFSGYFGQKYHVVKARKGHTCKLCNGVIEVGSECIRVFKLVIGEKNGTLKRYGWIQVFFHIECVRRDLESLEFKKKMEYRAQIKKCIGCRNFHDGHCFIKIGETLFVDAFDFCVKERERFYR